LILYSASIVSGSDRLYITYSQSFSTPTYIAMDEPDSNIIVQSASGFTGPVFNVFDQRPLTIFLGSLASGKKIRLCTGDYSLCSNSVTIGSTLGATDTRKNSNPWWGLPSALLERIILKINEVYYETQHQ